MQAGFPDRDFILVHRDANSVGYGARLAEIEDAYARSPLRAPVIPVIPVKETEAWLLHAFHDASFCERVGVAAATVKRVLPKKRDLSRVDAKSELHKVHAVVFAERGKRRAKRRIPKFETMRGEWLGQLNDPSLLNDCESFQVFSAAVKEALH